MYKIRINRKRHLMKITHINRNVIIRSKSKRGLPGVGIPTGGTTGQILAKKSNADYDSEWRSEQSALVTSVNGKVGAVVLDKTDIGLSNVDNTSDANKPVSTAQATAIAVVQSDVDAHEADTNNPHSVTKTQVGLGNVDNTSDLSKPISTATQSALDAKLTSNSPITGATKTKITYDAKGLVTAGVDATTADIADSTDKRYVTDVQKTVIQNTSGTNTGDQDLSGLVPNTRTVNGHPLSSNVTVTKSDVGLGNADNTSDANKPISTAAQTALNLKEDKSNKGVANGYAELDSGGLVPTSQLPSYVDDVKSYANFAAFPVTGESDKIYVAEDTNLTYRWSGSAYVEISSSLALGETSSTAYRGDRGKIAYDHSQLTSGNPHNVTKSNVGLGNVDNTSDANKPVSTAQAAADNLRVLKSGDTMTGLLTLSSTSTGILSYNTVDQVTDFESATIGWVSNNFKIGTKSGGAAADRKILLESADKGTGLVQLLVDRGASPFIHATHTTTSATRVAFQVSGTSTTSSGSYTGAAIVPTINQSSTGAYTALLINPTETATGSGAKMLLDAQAGGSSKFSISNLGEAVLSGSATIGVSVIMPSTSTGFISYNTSDQVTNYERYRHFWSSNGYFIGGEFGGTGTSRNITITPFGTSNTGGLKANASSLSGFVLSFGSSATNGAIIHSLTGTLSGASGLQYGLSLTPTFTQTSTAGYTALLINPTESTIGSGNKRLIDAQTGGTTRFLVNNSGAILNAAYVFVGSVTAPTNTASGDLTATRVSIGNGALGTSGRAMRVDFTNTVTSGTESTIGVINNITPASTSSAEYRAIYFQNIVNPTTGITFTGSAGIRAGYFENRIRSDGNIAVITGIQSLAITVDSSSAATADITTARAFSAVLMNRPSGTTVATVATAVGYDTASLTVGGGLTATNMYGFVMRNPTTGNTITNLFGLDIESLTRGGTLNAGIRIAAPSGATSNYALQLSDTGGGAPGGITFGTDTQLYRSATTTLSLSAGFLPTVTATYNLGSGSIRWGTVFAGTVNLSNASAISMAEGSNMVLGTTTGTKIGTATTQKLGFWNATPVVRPAAYTPTNVTPDRAFDADSTTMDEMADVLGTLINDLQSIGLIG